MKMCPKCGGKVVSSAHGPYCPKLTCKWGWEVEMDGSPLLPPVEETGEGAGEPVCVCDGAWPVVRSEYVRAGKLIRCPVHTSAATREASASREPEPSGLVEFLREGKKVACERLEMAEAKLKESHIEWDGKQYSYTGKDV